jgi:WD40 repeat protein
MMGFNEWKVELTGAAFSPDSKSLLIGYFYAGPPEQRWRFPKTLSMWDVGTRTERWSLERSDMKGFPFAFFPDGKQILVNHDDGLKVIDSANGKLVRSFDREDDWLQYLALSPNGKFALTAGSTDLKLWDITSGKVVQILQTSAFRSLAFSPDGKLMAAGAAAAAGDRNETAIWVWDVEKRDLLVALSGADGWGYPVVFSPDSKQAVSGWGDLLTNRSYLRLWEPRTGRVLRNFPNKTCEILAFSPDGKHMLYGDTRKQRMGRWDFATGKEIWTEHVGGLKSLAFSPDAKWAFTAVGPFADAGDFLIWDAVECKSKRWLGKPH